MKKNFKIEKIDTELNLIRAIELLKDGFNETDKFAYKILKYILVANKNTDFYGFSLYINDDLCASILTPFQGYYNQSNGNRIPVYNLSTWFSKEKSRGLLSIQHIYHVTKFLKNSIITNYSPGPNVIPIFKSLGFRSMGAIMIRKYRPSIKLALSNKEVLFKKIEGESIIEQLNPIRSINFSSCLEFFSAKKQEGVLFNFAGIIKKRKIKGLNIKSFYILWNSDFELLFKHINDIYFYLLSNYKTMVLYIYIPKEELENNKFNFKDFREIPFLIKGPENIKYISPLLSELSIGET